MLTLIPFSTSDLLSAHQRTAPWSDIGVPAPESPPEPTAGRLIEIRAAASRRSRDEAPTCPRGARLSGTDGMTGADAAGPSARNST